MSQQIRSISEAFSMQPITLNVEDVINNVKIFTINKETINFPVAGDPYDYWYYIGYTEQGKKIFEFRAETVNVFYFQ